MTSANLNLNYSFSSKQLESKNDKDDLNKIESTSSGGRDDDLFGMAEDFSDRRMNQEDQDETAKYPSYRSKMPWDLKIAYSLTYNNNRGQRDLSNNSLMFSGNRTYSKMEGSWCLLWLRFQRKRVYIRPTSVLIVT